MDVDTRWHNPRISTYSSVRKLNDPAGVLSPCATEYFIILQNHVALSLPGKISSRAPILVIMAPTERP